MVPVVAKAKPAELVLAVSAGHVHAPLVLLDVGFALGTRFGVDLKPVICVGLLVSADSIQPSLKKVAVDRGVGLLETAEAESFATVAEAINRSGFLDLNDLIASLTWAPLHLTRTINVRLV